MVRPSKTTLIVGAAGVAVAAAVVGGVAAHAASSTPSPSAGSTATPSPSATGKSGKAAGKHHAGKEALGKGVLHGQWVTKGTSGAYVTHDAIRGTVTAASPTSITVKAADGVTQTYAESGTTKVMLRQAQGTKPTTGSASDVKTGSSVVVLGTGTASLTAERVLVGR